MAQHQRTELFVLFPEYVDSDTMLSAPYVKSLELEGDNDLPTAIKEIIHDVGFFSYEKADRYYDSTNISGILKFYKTLQYPNLAGTLSIGLSKRGFKDWRTDFLKESIKEVTYYDNSVKRDTCYLSYRHNAIDTKDLKVHSAVFATNSTIALEEGYLKLHVREDDMELQIPVIQDMKSLYKWFCENRLPQRKFYVDDKHGENGKGARAIPGKGIASKLECYRDEAQSLLVLAVSDGTAFDDLWYYDTNRRKYIWFENQGDTPELAFHGYHLNPGAKNYDKVNPAIIKQIADDIDI